MSAYNDADIDIYLQRVGEWMFKSTIFNNGIQS